MRRMMLLALAVVLMASATTVLAWPLVVPGDGDGADREPPTARDDDDRPPPPPPPPPHPPNHLDRVFEEMELSKDQKAKVEKIVKAHHDAVRKFMDKARADLLKEMKSVLSKEQYREFEKAMKHHGPGHDGPPPKGPREKDRPGKRPPPPPPPDDRD